MNKIQKLGQVLEKFAPVFYGVIDLQEGEKRPFPCFVMITKDYEVVHADNKKAYRSPTIQVEHYFKIKDLDLEDRLYKALEDAGFLFEETGDSYENKERMYIRYIIVN